MTIAIDQGKMCQMDSITGGCGVLTGEVGECGSVMAFYNLAGGFMETLKDTICYSTHRGCKQIGFYASKIALL